MRLRSPRLDARLPTRARSARRIPCQVSPMRHHESMAGSGVLGNTDASGTTPTVSDAHLGHRTLIAFNRAMTHWGSRGALLETGGAVLCAGGSWIPVVANGAFRSDDSLSGTALVAAADTFFAGLSRGYT